MSSVLRLCMIISGWIVFGLFGRTVRCTYSSAISFWCLKCVSLGFVSICRLYSIRHCKFFRILCSGTYCPDFRWCIQLFCAIHVCCWALKEPCQFSIVCASTPSCLFQCNVATFASIEISQVASKSDILGSENKSLSD